MKTKTSDIQDIKINGLDITVTTFDCYFYDNYGGNVSIPKSEIPNLIKALQEIKL